MGRKCTVCISPQRAEIDKAAIDPNSSIREVAERFGITYSSMARHVENHLPKLMSKALEERKAAGERGLFDEHPPVPPAIKEHEEREIELGGTLLDRLSNLETQGKEILAEARQAKSLKTALMAIGKLGDLLKLEGELVGKIKAAQVRIQNNIVYLTQRQSEEEWTKQQQP